MATYDDIRNALEEYDEKKGIFRRLFGDQEDIVNLRRFYLHLPYQANPRAQLNDIHAYELNALLSRVYFHNKSLSSTVIRRLKTANTLFRPMIKYTACGLNWEMINDTINKYNAKRTFFQRIFGDPSHIKDLKKFLLRHKPPSFNLNLSGMELHEFSVLTSRHYAEFDENYHLRLAVHNAINVDWMKQQFARTKDAKTEDIKNINSIMFYIIQAKLNPVKYQERILAHKDKASIVACEDYLSDKGLLNERNLSRLLKHKKLKDIATSLALLFVTPSFLNQAIFEVLLKHQDPVFVAKIYKIAAHSPHLQTPENIRIIAAHPDPAKLLNELDKKFAAGKLTVNQFNEILRGEEDAKIVKSVKLPPSVGKMGLFPFKGVRKIKRLEESESATPQSISKKLR